VTFPKDKRKDKQAMGLRNNLFLLGLFLFPLFLSHAEARDQTLDVSYERGLISVSAESAELDDVLTAIADKTGISVDAPEQLNEVITIRFQNIPLEEGLHRILKDIDHVLFFSSSGEKTGKESVSGVFIPFEELGGRGLRRSSSPSLPRAVAPREERPETAEEELAVEEREIEEEPEEDPVVVRYENQIDRLEQQLETMDEESPQGKAVISQIQRLQEQIEKRLQELEGQESP
jgi:hypothetical protein